MKRILHFLPERFKWKWLFIYLINSVLFIGLSLVTNLLTYLLGADLDGVVAVVYIFLLGILLFIHLIGFFGSKNGYLLALIGFYGITVISMVNTTANYAGWEYFSAVLIGFLGGGGFILLGLIVELIRLIMKKNNRTINPKISDALWMIYILLIVATMIISIASTEYEPKINQYEDPGYMDYNIE